MKSSNKFIKFVRSAHQTAQELRTCAAAYESRWAVKMRIELMVEKFRSQICRTLLNGHRLRESLVRVVALVLLSSSLFTIVTAANAQDSNLAEPSEGKAVLRILVAADGSVKEAVVSVSSGFPKLDEAAVKQALSAWKLNPGTEDGKPIEMWTTVPVFFKLTDQPKDDAKKIRAQQIIPADRAENGAPAE